LHMVLRVKIKLYNLYVCKASFLSRSLQEHSTTCVWCGLIVLDTILAVECSFFSKAEGGVLKMNCDCQQCASSKALGISVMIVKKKIFQAIMIMYMC